jgi:hypothetical protein
MAPLNFFAFHPSMATCVFVSQVCDLHDIRTTSFLSAPNEGANQGQQSHNKCHEEENIISRRLSTTGIKMAWNGVRIRHTRTKEFGIIPRPRRATIDELVIVRSGWI